MANKSKNKKRSVSSTPEVVQVKSAAAPKISARTTTMEFNPDYSYVKKDLTRIGILAGSFFVVLVVLSFFLR